MLAVTIRPADLGSDLETYSVSDGNYRIDSISTGKTVFNALHALFAPKVLVRFLGRRPAQSSAVPAAELSDPLAITLFRAGPVFLFFIFIAVLCLAAWTLFWRS